MKHPARLQVEEELEAVAAVYLDDLEDGAVALDDEGACCFKMRIRPDTAGEDALVRRLSFLPPALQRLLRIPCTLRGHERRCGRAHAGVCLAVDEV